MAPYVWICHVCLLHDTPEFATQFLKSEKDNDLTHERKQIPSTLRRIFHDFKGHLE